MNRRKADLALAFNTVVWGSTFVLVKAALPWTFPRFCSWRSDSRSRRLALLACFSRATVYGGTGRTALAGGSGGCVPVRRLRVSDLGLAPHHAPPNPPSSPG